MGGSTSILPIHFGLSFTKIGLKKNAKDTTILQQIIMWQTVSSR